MNQPIAAPLSPLRPIPRATYRLQLHRDFGFREATLALPYLAALGISHVYCSPYLRATPGSRHGYDVVDPCTINPDLGTPEDFNRFNRELRAYGLTQLLDIVPNHMGVESGENAWWQDVLRHGRSSPFAGYFDIDWSGSTGLAAGKLLLPVLGVDLEQAIAERQIKLRWDPEARVFRLDYYERSLPVNARGTAMIFAAAAAAEAADSNAAGGEAAGAGQEAEHQGGREADLEKCLQDRALVAEVANCQHYELAPWQDASKRINYRRFFDVSGLAALRIEDPAIFEITHRQVLELVRAGIVSGLRVDHPDGLRDPATYFKRLQEAVAEGGDDHRSKGPLYIVAEKILAEGEDLPTDWPVNGTTGYDFANLACGLLLDGETAAEVDRVWRGFTREAAASFGDLAVAAKKEVLEHSFGSEMTALSGKFLTLLPQPLQRPENLPRVGAVLAETIACFPVYRTYPGPQASEEERRVIHQACSEAARRLEARGPSVPGGSDQGAIASVSDLFGALEEILTGPTGDVELPADAPASARERAQWAVRFQQLSAPVMAKGVEDTALYRWTRLVSINDVGADPDVTGVTVDHFHEANRRRRAGWPHAMLATSTHDNKRGEYVRMRINVISEDPSGWRSIAEAWQREAMRLMEQDGMARRPSESDQYLLFQTFIGTWPLFSWRPQAYETSATGGSPSPAEGLEEPLQNYAERLKAYMTKACREAKVDTSWTQPDEAYEQGVHRLIDLILGDAALGARIGREVVTFGWYGALNSLSLTALKLTVPGVPDIYQGANVLDDSLVDPDNRRPVEFSERKEVILELAELAAKPAADIQSTLAAWVADGDFPRLKLWTIHRLLNWRALHPQLFESGEYVPVPVKGPLARHCVAYARRNERHGILVVATRLYRQLGFPGPGETDASAGDLKAAWGEEALDLEAAGIRAVHFNDILSTPVNPADFDDVGATAATASAPSTPGSLSIARLLSVLPVAVLSFDIDKSGG